MRTVKLTLTEVLHKYLVAQVGEQSRFASPEEYICDLIRKDQARGAERILDELLMQGIASAPRAVTRSWGGGVMREIKRRAKAEARVGRANGASNH